MYNTIQYNTIQYNTIQYNTIQYNTIQYNTIQYNTYNTIQYNTIQYNTIQNECKVGFWSVFSTCLSLSALSHIMWKLQKFAHPPPPYGLNEINSFLWFIN